MVECLNCGKRRSEHRVECPRCAYVGWAPVEDVSERLRRRLREHPLSSRRLRAAS